MKRGYDTARATTARQGIRRSPFYCAFLIDLDGNNVEAGCYLKD
jgi:hypothetical protein